LCVVASISAIASLSITVILVCFQRVWTVWKCPFALRTKQPNDEFLLVYGMLLRRCIWATHAVASPNLCCCQQGLSVFVVLWLRPSNAANYSKSIFPYWTMLAAHHSKPIHCVLPKFDTTEPTDILFGSVVSDLGSTQIILFFGFTPRTLPVIAVNLTRVGTQPLRSLHNKLRTLCGALIFQTLFQSPLCYN